MKGTLHKVWSKVGNFRATTFITSLAFLLLFLATSVLKAKPQTHPKLTSHLACGCLNSKHESVPYEFYFRTRVTRIASAWEYQYSFHNAAATEIRLLVYINEDGNVEFASAFITDASKQPNSQYGQGSIFITVPAHASRSFAVIDSSPPVEVIGHVRVLDTHDSIYGGGDVSLYFPRWERLFR